MKARIKIRRVYYKYAEIEINFPSTELHNATDYILEKETEWGHELESAIEKAELGHGNGMDSDDGWTDVRDEEEVRYEVDPDGDSYRMGGHL